MIQTIASARPGNTRKVRAVEIIMAMVLVLLVLMPNVVSAALLGFGGFLSEKALGNGVGEQLTLGDGSSETIVLGTAPAVATVGASSVSAGGVTATFRGNLTSLNGMSKADVWFAWGYAPGALTNTTPAVTRTTTGVFTAVVSPTVGVTVYYQARAGTDGLAVGSVLSVFTGGAHGTSYWLMQTILLIVIAAGIIITVVLVTGNILMAFIYGVVGVIGFYIIQAVVRLF